MAERGGGAASSRHGSGALRALGLRCLLLLVSSALAVEHHHLHPQPKPRHGSDVPLLPMMAPPLPMVPLPPRSAHAGNATAAERSAAAGCFGDSFRFGVWKPSASSDASSPFKKTLVS